MMIFGKDNSPPSLRTDFLVRVILKISSLFVCIHHNFVCRLVPEIQVWKHVQLLVLAVLAGLGGLGLLGDWGPLKFAPQQSESQVSKDLLSHRHTFYNCTFDTKALLWIRVSTPVKELKDPSLTKGS